MFLAIHVRDCTADVHAILLDCGSAFSPRVEDASPTTVVLDIEGLNRLLGSFSEIAAQVSRHVTAAAGLQPNIGIASNPDAAIMVARGNNGITIAAEGNEAASLQPLPVHLLPIEDDARETLVRWGIETLGALAALPIDKISARLGQMGVRLHKLAAGVLRRPLVPLTPPLSFKEQFDLDESIDLLEPLTFILSRLLDQLFSRLRRRGLATAELHLRLDREHPHDPDSRVLNLPFPVQNSRIITKLLMLDLEARPPGAAVIGVNVEAIPAKPRVIQSGLFVPLSPEPEKLELTLARIATVVGASNVGLAEVADSHARDRFQMKRFGVGGSRQVALQVMEVGAGKTMALRLLRPALEATVQCRAGVPAWIGCAILHGPIETASGPWNASGDWWNRRQWDREEWDIETVDGRLLRIYLDRLTGRWHAEGVYD